MVLPNNLRLNLETGQLYCADGQDVAKYIQESQIVTLNPDILELEVVLLSRKQFLELYAMARLAPHIIWAA